jgi:hypothetical protein
VSPAEVFVPGGLPFLEDGDDSSAGHEAEGFEAKREWCAAGDGYDGPVPASARYESGGELGVEPVRAGELPQCGVGAFLAEAAGGAAEFVVAELPAAVACRPFVVAEGGLVVHGGSSVRGGAAGDAELSVHQGVDNAGQTKAPVDGGVDRGHGGAGYC